jgi:hypothetical protein
MANKHMIAISEALGFRAAENGWQFCELPVSSVVEP